MKSTGMGESANGAVGPAVKDDDEEEEEKLGKADARQYRADAARLNYLAQVRSVVQYAAKEIFTCMSNPTTKGLRKLQRAVSGEGEAGGLAHEGDRGDAHFHRCARGLGLGWMQNNEAINQWMNASRRRRCCEVLEPGTEEPSIVFRRSGVLRDGWRKRRSSWLASAGGGPRLEFEGPVVDGLVRG